MDKIHRNSLVAALCAAFLFLMSFSSFGQNIIYSCDFEDETENSNWIFANCDYYNGWYIGTGAYNGGSKGLYISNDYGTSNSADYDETYVYAYREINATETDQYLIDFDWRAVGATPDENSGEGYCLLRSFLVPTTLSPNLNECDYNGMSSDNNTTPSGWIDVSSSENGLMYGQSSWQHSSKVLSIDAGTYYLVFFWKNNSDHIDPPAAVDNISISRVVNPAVATSSVSNLGASSVTLNGEILNHGASDVTARGFMYGISSGNLSNTIPSTDNTDAFSYELTGLTENTTYYYRAYATNSDGTGYGVVKSFKTLNTLNDHIFVDLGLPSGLLWATTNVGANSPEDSGDYFSWGETTPKGLYSLENYKYSNSESELLTKYCDNSQYGHDGFVDNLSTLEASDDAATANWGAGWHMPSVSEFEELMDNCTLTWTTQNGATGYLFTGSNGSSIFMPAAGYRNDDDLLTGPGEYWARTNVSTLPNYANYLGFYEDNPFTDYESRHFGYSVRPVLTASPTVETKSATDVESTTATLQGKILFAEDATVTNRGFLFGTDSEDLAQNFTSANSTDNFTYSVSDLTANTTYYFKAYATINSETKYGEIKSFTTTNASQVNPEYVDLGLPSGIKWANMNIGATQPSDFGNRYAWGETTPKDVNSYSWENYIHCAGTNNDLTKYCFSSIWGHNDYTDELTTLEATDDAATVNWGEGWRMPTDEECQELYNNCSASWDTQNGVVGVTLTSRSNGNSIFIPIDPEENYGTHYWSSSFGTDDDDPTMGKTLYLNASNQIVSSGGDQRNRPNAIRPVYVQSNTANNNNNTFTDDRDGQTYKFVTIGNQIWMAENLRYNNNLTVDTEGETSDTDPYIYYPNGDVANFGTYGYLYNWPAAMNGESASDANPSGVQGICPSGWHLPSNAEWTQLKDYLGGEYSAAKLAGRADLWDSDAGESDYLITESEYFGTTGFNALPAGERRGTSYYDINRLASFWTATEESSSSYAYIRDIHNYSFEIYEDNHDKSWARSIRCVKNAETVFQGNFEDADENANWTLANGNQTNQWYIGTATNNGGNYSLYISSDGGASNGYDYTSASNVYAYYTLEISEAADYNISFDWITKANALVAFLAPLSSSQQPVAGTLLTDIPDDWTLIGSFSNGDSWQSFSKRLYISEGDYYFILYWTNSENDGNNPPPAAVDNIVINKAPQVITETFVDDRDGQSYSYVNIGSQTWMSENLRFVGDIPIGTETSETIAYRYTPNGDNANVATYGYLYNWPAAMNGEESSSENPSGVHGICPEGWHLPSEQEWVQLFDYLGGTQNAGSMLAGRSDLWGNGDLTQSQNFGTTGFNAMPAGNYAGSAQNFGSIARFWTTTEMSNSAYYKEIRSNYTDIYSDAQGKDFGNSVRCVKNAYPTANNYQCGFDDDAEFANWTIQGANSGQPNYWTIGQTEQGEANLNSLFITDGGGNYSYTNSSTSAVYAYCRMEFTELLNYNISFDWQCNGESNYDYLRAFLIPTSAEPNLSAGNEIANGHTETPNGWIDLSNGQMDQAGREWMHADKTMIIEPGLYYLVFYWRNDDGAGDNPPAAVDNIRIVKLSCPPVTDITASDITIESATLTWTEIGSAESWDIIVSETELSDTDLETYNNFTTVSSPSYSATGLEQAHTYYIYVRAACSSDEKSGWASGVFSSAFCTAVDMCSIRYELEDSYGDGWNGNTLNVVDASTDEVLASWTIEDGSSMEGTLAVCNGRDIRFEYVGDNYPDETSYRVYDVNDDLIFEGSDKFTDPIHYMMSCSSCLSVANLAITEIAAQSATISWEDRNSAETWEIIFSDQNLSGPELDGATVQTLTDSTYSLSSLTPTTIYYVYVRSVCSAEEKSGWKSLTFRTTQVPAQIPYSYGFEDESENSIWTLNAGAINGWYVGEAAYNEGSKGLYVSNDSGETNSYDTGSETSIYAYRTLNIPELCYYSVSFDWMANGESSYDYLRAFLVPASLNADLSSGVQNGISETATPANWIELYSNGGKMNGLDLWQTNTIEVALEQGLYNLVFYWRNDNGGGEIPPAAIDNISVTKLVPFRLSAQVQPGWGSTAATLEGNIDFLGEVQTLTAGFEFGVDNTHFADSVPVVSSDGTFSHEFTGLEAQTTYYYRGFVIYNDEPIYTDIAQFKTRNNDNGTESSPLIIESESDWGEFVTAIQNGAGFGADAMGEYKGSEIVDGAFGMYFKIGNDITLTSSNITVNGFKGILLGDGKTITLDNSAGYGTDFKGLFSTIYNATIDSLNISLAQSITIPSPETSDNNGFGLLCSEVYSSSVISDCTISGGEGILLNCNDVRFGAGALVGSVNDATITNCTNNLDVDGYYVAGIAGLMKGGTISKCTNNAAIKSETEGYYVGGIVYSIEGNVQSTITECLNTGALTSGGIAGGIVARINGSNSTISKCMNIGQITTNYTDWSTGEYAGGIVGGSRMSSTITNNANYGSFGRLSSNIGGIAGNNMTSLSKNVSAPVYLSESIAGNSSYNIFATMSVSVDNYETANEEDDDFFDEQIGDIKVDSLRLRFASQATAMQTNDMVGSALSSSLSNENWIFTNGLYPMPAGIPESPKTTVARIPMYLAEDETVFGVMSNFTVPTTISGQTVEWTSSSPDVIAISDGSATVTRPASGEADVDVTLTATCQGETKSFIVRVIGPKQVPVLTEGATVGTSVILNGEFGSEAEGIITYTKEYGFKYGKESDLSDAVNIVSTNLGTNLHESTRFTAVINDFDDSKYYYAAYATTADATTLGEIKSFKKSTAPEVIAKYPMWRTNSEATIEFDITLNEGEEFYGVESAFYYGTESNNLNLTGIINYDDDYGYYSTDLSNLTADTKYYYVAEVSNDLGTTRSDTLEFLTCGTMTDSRDGTQYYTIRIGNQTWMAQNLKYAGNIPQGSETSSTDAYRYNPDDFSDAVDEYGYLYNWAATMNGENPTNENPSSVQGICPSGWHLPSDAEWTQLTDYLGGTENAGVLLAGQPAAQDRYWQTSDMTMSVTFGKSGFNALPAGYYVGTNYSSFGSGTGFWSATENTSEYAYVRSIYYESTSMDRNYDNKVKGNSVRCVKGSVVYAYDTLPYCGESFAYHDTVITASGDYTVRIQNGETENIYKLHLTLYPALVPTISSYSNGCYGENNGYVEVDATGGAGDYSYAWSTPDMQTDARLSNLADGEYTVTVTDAAGCTATISQTLITPGELTASVSGNNPNCYGDQTTLTANANGGTTDYSYAWSSGESTSSITVSPTATTTYTVTVTDANNCTVAASKNIVVNTELTVSISGDTEVQCFGDITASLTATASGGSMAMGYTYAWSNSQSGQIISTLGAGNYSVTVTDGNSCTASASTTITGPSAALSINISATNNTLTCSNLSATITATVTGGTEGYTYNWSNSGTNNTSEVTTPGSYTVVVTDANGCSVEAAQTITEDKTAPTVTIDNNETELNCNRTSITLTATGSDASYVWSNGGTNAATTVTAPATYTVTATGDNGCTNETSVTITKVENPTVDVTASEILCNGATTTFTANVSNGAAPYSYSWQDDLGSSQTLNAHAGTYSVTVMDSNSCTASASGTANQPEQLTASVTKTDVLCNGASNGTATVTVDGGTDPYTYVWSDNADRNSNTATGLTTGTYSIIVSDANGCSTTVETTIDQPSTLTASASAGMINCYGGTTTATVAVNGGTEPYTYVWSDNAARNSNTASDITAGTYSVTVTDANGCSADAATTITEPDELTVSLSATEILCNGGTTTVTAAPNGGTSPYAYAWQGNSSTESSLSGVAGTYSVTVTDNNGCSATESTTVSVNDQTAPELTGTWPSNITGQNNCFANADINELLSDDDIEALYEDCSGLTVSHNDANTSTDNCAWTITRTYTIQDTYGNAVTPSPTMSVSGSDQTGPTIGDDNLNRQLTSTNCTFTVPDLTSEVRSIANDNCTANDDLTITQNPTAGTEITTATTVTVTVTDQCGNSSTKEIELTLPNELTTSLSAGTIACNGGTAEVTNTVTGGTEPYQFAWNNDATTQNLTGVSGGTYSVTVTDANNCTASASATVNEPDQLTSTLSAGTISCHGGTADVTNTVTGGTEPYQFAWSNDETSQSLEGVRGGTYSVTVTDANSCSATATTTVIEPDQLTSILSAGTIACNGGTTDITNTVSGGTEPFTYEWSNDATTQNLTGVGAGTYEVFVRDANGCVVSQHIDIEQPNALTTLLSAGTIACNGGTTDIINTVSGGTPDYQYFWTDDTHNQNNEGVSAGNYSVTVQDANGCSATASIEITQPNVLTSTLSAGTISCHGGTADVTNTVTGGTEPYQFAWSNEATTQSLEGVRGGTYSVTVTDANSCSATATTTVNEPDQLTSILSAGTIDCNGGTTDITNSVSGGTEPITYEWSNEANTQNLTGVGAGTYEVFVRDANGCVVSQHIDIEQPDVLTASLTAGTVSCNGGTTNITSTVNGGTPNFTYAWSNEATTDELTGVGAGTYSVTVTDANTCTASAIVTITQPNALSVSISGPTSVCENTTSTLTANVQGGTADFTYLWSNSATTVSITTPQLSVATEYSVTVTDANDCSATASVNVEIGDTPGISISEVTPICVGGNKILQANVSNAGDDYTLEWSSTDTNAGLPADITTDAITVTPTTAGTYTYTVSLTATSCSDGQPFTSSDFVTLTVNSLPDAAITNSTNEMTITCTTTEISLTATGGNTYAWSNGVAIADNNVTSAATYTVTVTDANECSNTASITISEDVAAPIVSITNNTGTTLLTCTTTTINVEATGDDASYLWSNEVTTATNAITTSGTYTVTATADNGCTSTAAIEITPNDDVPTVSITNNTGETELTCALTSISVTATGSGTSYQWSGGASTEEANNTFTAPGTYIVTATAGNGCSASDQITITRNIEAPDITASATANAICQGESTTISATGGQSYTWSPDTGLPTTVGSSITASPTSTITYTVTGVGENGCNGTAEVTVTVNQPNSSEFAETACDSYEWNGTTYDQTGDYTQTFTNANGCDSVVTLHLTINNSQTNIVDISACESYEWAGETYTETGEYNHTFTAANGCDSVVTLHLTINQPVAHEITETACEMFTWNGSDYTETGDYTGTFTAANGCDSIVTLHLTINNATTGVDTQVACNSYTWIDGNTYTESTDAPTFTLTNANGCDSVVTLHLTINYSTTGEFADQMCSGVPYTYEGQTFTEAGTYQVTLTNANGCDSIVTLTLTYANNCSGLVSGVITDENTGYAIPNAKVTIGNRVTRTNAEGQYSLEVIRGLKALRVSATGYISYSRTVDIQSDTTFDASLNAPQIHTDTDSILVSSYPYLEQSDSVTLSNNGNGTLVWSSITEYDNLELIEDSTIQRRNTRSLWDSIQTFATRENAEQAIATDGFFIYTASWMRPGEFNRYTPNGEYIETFYVENVGSIRNLSYDGTYFYGTEATNIIFKIDLDNQTLVDSIETDIPEIRHCSFNRQDGSLLAGSWNSLYRIDTASGTSQQIRDDLANVYSSAFDNLSSGGPYLWLFSQTSQNNGPSACIRQFNISTGEYTGKTHYLDDINLTNSSLAGGICASEYVCEGKFVLLADVQNPAGSNTIATYEIGRTSNVVKTGKKSGTIEPNGSESISVKANATATGDYTATIKYRAAVMGRQSNDINVSISAIAPECEAVQQISIVTDTFHTVTLDWQPVELGDYDNVSYFVYNSASQYPIDTLSGTTVTYDGLPVGEHCFYVRALSSSNYTCLSGASDTVCAEIQNIPCNVSLIVEARTDGEAITISWNKPVGVEYFSIYRYSEPLAEHLTSTTFVDTNVEPETDYCYIIIAHFENGICDEISATVCTRIAGDGCAEAPVLTAEALGAYVALEWTGNGALSYSVFRDNEFIGTTDGLSYMDNVPESGNYCYRVESTCEYGMYNSSNEACVSAEVNGDGDAIEEWSADNLTLYPNPTYGQFFIKGQRIAVVQIFNASGQLVSEIENTEDEHITINCESWNPGIYNVRIISAEGETATRKVTIFR